MDATCVLENKNPSCCCDGPCHHVSICRFLAAILNGMLLPAAVTYVRQITVSYPSTDFSV